MVVFGATAGPPPVPQRLLTSFCVIRILEPSISELLVGNIEQEIIRH